MFKTNWTSETWVIRNDFSLIYLTFTKEKKNSEEWYLFEGNIVSIRCRFRYKALNVETSIINSRWTKICIVVIITSLRNFNDKDFTVVVDSSFQGRSDKSEFRRWEKDEDKEVERKEKYIIVNLEDAKKKLRVKENIFCWNISYPLFVYYYFF